MDLTARRAAESDLDGVARLYMDVNNYLSATENYPGWINGVYPTRRDAEDALAEGTLYTAHLDGALAGSVIINRKPAKAYFGAPWRVGCGWDETLIVHTLAVGPDYMRRGVGGALLRFADALAREEKMRAIRLDSYKANTPAFRLYEKHGYIYIGMADLDLHEYGLDWFRLYEKPVI